MINPEKCITTLIESGDLPSDSEIVSTNNKVVVVSREDAIVARINEINGANVRDDPHDLSYSHHVSLATSKVAPVVAPLDQHPVIRHGYLISRYPLLESSITITDNNVQEVYNCVGAFANALHAAELGPRALRELDVSSYAQERIEDMQRDPRSFDQRLVDYVAAEIEHLQVAFPFLQLVADQKGLVHGDVKVDNFVKDKDENIRFIDLDAAAVGPKTYDLVSWRLRAELGDTAPVEEIVEIGRTFPAWNEEAYRALIGWKAVSSMSFTLRYEDSKTSQNKIYEIAGAVQNLGGSQSLAALPKAS